MSTCYSAARKPVTSVRVDESAPPHVKITVFLNHQNAGTIVANAPEKHDVLRLFFEDDDCVTSASRNLYRPRYMSDDQQLLSEYGDLTTFGEIRKGYEPSQISDTSP